MSGENAARRPQQQHDLLLADPADDDPFNDWGQWSEFEPCLVDDELFDAFDSDDEMEEPEPEHGDFWGELQEEDEI